MIENNIRFIKKIKISRKKITKNVINYDMFNDIVIDGLNIYIDACKHIMNIKK